MLSLREHLANDQYCGKETCSILLLPIQMGLIPIPQAWVSIWSKCQEERLPTLWFHFLCWYN